MAALFAPCALAGAWPAEKGRAQLIAGVSALRSSSDFDPDGSANIDRDFEKLAIDIYAEYGLTDTLTFIGKTAAEQTVSEFPGRDPVETKNDPGLQMSLRQTFRQTDTSVFALQGGIILGDGINNVPGNEQESGDVEYKIGLIAGRSGTYKNRDIFAQAHGAYRIRGTGLADEYSLDLAAGFEPAPRYQVFLEGFYAQAGDSDNGFARFKRFKVQPSVTFAYKPGRRIQFGVSQTVWGENTIEDTGAFIAFWRHY